MVDLADVPILGRLVTLFAAFGDLFLHGGDLVLSIAFLAVENFDVAARLLRLLSELSHLVPWLPAGLFDDALATVVVVLLVVEILRFVDRKLSQA